MANTNENLIKARDCAQFAADDLRRALTNSSTMEALIILPLIGDATRLAQQVDALISAKSAHG